MDYCSESVSIFTYNNILSFDYIRKQALNHLILKGIVCQTAWYQEESEFLH